MGCHEMTDETPPPDTDTPPTFTVVDGEREPDSVPRRGRKPVSAPTDTKGRKTSTGVPGYQSGVISLGMANFYSQIGVLINMFDQHCGTAILANAQPMADSLEKLAKENH